MIELDIPGRGKYELEHLVMDVNGTLAVDGHLLEGVVEKVTSLQDRLTVHLLTADTHGRQAELDKQLGLVAVRIAKGREDLQKQEYVRSLGYQKVIAVGQGANDAGMLEAAAVGICVMSTEGAAKDTVMAADIIVPNILTALELLEHPLRIVATLRR